jgi:predicted nucleotidyltransferase component of viral defense system
MKLLQVRLKEIAAIQKVGFEIIEQDYMLSWLLSGISAHPVLSQILVFKGGTALKKCYFGDYRFSQDLDFTLIKNIEYENLNRYVQEACSITQNKLHEIGEKCEIICQEYQAISPHPQGQKAYVILTGLLWHRKPMIKLMIEITRDELVLNPAEIKNIIHTYGETIDTKIQVYCLEEIIQQIIKMHERGWGRSRARDFYDIWMIFNKYEKKLNLDLIRNNIDKKFAIKDIKFNSINDFFESKYIDEVIRTWNQWLGPFVKNLPEANYVLQDVKEKILPVIFTNNSKSIT